MDEWVTVPQADVARAMVEVGSHTGIVAEAGSAAAIAAFERASPEMRHRHVVIIIGGGLSQEQLERAYAVATAQQE